MKRPTAPRLYPCTWRTTEDSTPGYALRGGCGHIVGHLTAEEARVLADSLHDAADKMDRFAGMGYTPQGGSAQERRYPA